jgi:hypothetical protein
MSNRVRLFSDVVSLDAWHDRLKPNQPSGVFVELAFREGRLGGERDDFPFTFTLRLKRAELLVTVEPPLRIARRSIVRGSPAAEVRRSESVTRVHEASAAASASASAGAGMPVGKFKLEGQLATQNSHRSTVEVSDTPPAILIAGDPVSDGGYRWSLEPSYLAHLIGQPWDPVLDRRLDVVLRGARHGIEPTIHVELNCRIADLSVSDIVPKNPSLAEWVRGMLPTDRRLKVAEQHIKHVLRTANLEAGAFDNRFAKLVLASVASAAEEVM